MFTTFSQNAILAKIKAMYGKRITPSQYGEMLHKTSLSELAAYLKNSTHYQDAMDTVNPAALHRGQLEATVRKDLFYSLLRLVRYLPCLLYTSCPPGTSSPPPSAVVRAARR